VSVIITVAFFEHSSYRHAEGHIEAPLEQGLTLQVGEKVLQCFKWSRPKSSSACTFALIAHIIANNHHNHNHHQQLPPSFIMVSPQTATFVPFPFIIRFFRNMNHD
jgi:hypothetical protein